MKPWFSTKFDQTFPEPRNSNPVSVGRNYAVNFLANKGVLGRNIDFRQSLTKGLLVWGIRIRSQLGETRQPIFSQRKAIWTRILIFDKVKPKVFGCKKFECWIGFVEKLVHSANLSSGLIEKIYSFYKCFPTENTNCIILTKWDRIRIPDPPKAVGQTLSKINISAQKCFLSEKIKCIILTIWHRNRIPE